MSRWNRWIETSMWQRESSELNSAWGEHILFRKALVSERIINRNPKSKRCRSSASSEPYLHPLVPVRVVELHVVARLDPADGPRLFAGHGGHLHPRERSEVRRPVPQHDAGGLIDARGIGVDWRVHLQHHDTLSEAFGFTPDALDAAHRIEYHHSPQQRPEVWGGKMHGHNSETKKKKLKSRQLDQHSRSSSWSNPKYRHRKSKCGFGVCHARASKTPSSATVEK